MEGKRLLIGYGSVTGGGGGGEAVDITKKEEVRLGVPLNMQSKSALKFHASE